MLARLVRNPLLIGVGAGAVLILGSASAVLAQAGPSPGASPSATESTGASPTGSSTPSAPQLAVTLARTDKTAIHAGTDVEMTATVAASGGSFKDVLLGVTADKGAGVVGGCVTSPGDPRCKLDTVPDGPPGVKVELHVTISKGMPSGTVTVNAMATSGDTKVAAEPFLLKVTETSSPDPHGSTGSGGTNTGGGKKTTGGKTTGTSGSSGTTGGSTGDVPAPMSTLSPPSTSGLAPSTAPSPGAMLPSIGAQPPATAGNPQTVNTGNTQSMRGKAEGPDELTFNKLASTQAAWLAALLVAFSLLLTQVRLGRTANRAAGVHSKLRRRVRRRRSP